ncbi:MAG TPA: hypothetical protein VEZ40_04270 [Pyrinomonadaceae bacterium]|nr:hypothetical protein [Pyrinomonadaceae bacterium]
MRTMKSPQRKYSTLLMTAILLLACSLWRPLEVEAQGGWTNNGSNITNVTDSTKVGNSGNVGVGAQTPIAPLHIFTINANPGLVIEGGAAVSPTLEFRDGATSQNRWRMGSGMVSQTDGMFGILDLKKSYPSLYRLVINPEGFVGIRTHDPQYRLDVQEGQINASDGLCIANVCKTNWSQVGGSGWTDSGTSVTLTNQSAKVGIGKSPSPEYTLDVEGDLNATGTITGNNVVAKYQDIAEWVPSIQQLDAGSVVVLDTERSNHVLASSHPYDTKVAGVVSAMPGIALGEKGRSKLLVATTGRVKVRIDATRAPIKIGDLLVTSDVPGMAMKSEPMNLGGRKIHAPGTIIGKALEPLAKGVGEILVLLSLQ